MGAPLAPLGDAPSRGVANREDEEFRAHAWVERDGNVLIGGAESPEKYERFDDLSTKIAPPEPADPSSSPRGYHTLNEVAPNAAPSAVQDRLRTVTLFDTPVRAFSPEDTRFYFCLHGTSRRWSTCANLQVRDRLRDGIGLCIRQVYIALLPAFSRLRRWWEKAWT